MIIIVDYGVGNLSSVKNALDTLGYESKISNNEKEIENAKGIILPGVGAFNDAIKLLRKSGLDKSIYKAIDNGGYILGICLGMQLLYERSFEDGEWEGLGILEGDIVKFKDNVKIPHMGWNSLKVIGEDKILKYIGENDYVYFVHSYYGNTLKNGIAYVDYDVKVPAIVGKNRVYGMQFHPEKSGDIGIKLLKAFGEMIK